MNSPKLIAFDLDGTITQHRTEIEDSHYAVLTELSRRYRLVMCGAGLCRRIFGQMRGFPIDIIGNYGLQYAEYDKETDDIVLKRDLTVPCDRESVSLRAEALREKYGFTEYYGDPVEFHSSGCVTIPVLGTKAPTEKKLAFDPNRSIRRSIYADVCSVFPEYKVFVGGSSSFDMAPHPHDKAYALAEYCDLHGIGHGDVFYVGDDYGKGGNDESVFLSDFNFVKIDDYRKFPELMTKLFLS